MNKQREGHSNDFLRPVLTPCGPGLLLGQSADHSQVLIVHKASDVAPALRAKHRPGARIINAWYPLADLPELALVEAR